MIISRKRLNKMLDEREKQTAEKFEKLEYERDRERYMHERIDRIEKRVAELEIKTCGQMDTLTNCVAEKRCV